MESSRAKHKGPLDSKDSRFEGFRVGFDDQPTPPPWASVFTVRTRSVSRAARINVLFRPRKRKKKKGNNRKTTSFYDLRAADLTEKVCGEIESVVFHHAIDPAIRLNIETRRFYYTYI